MKKELLETALNISYHGKALQAAYELPYLKQEYYDALAAYLHGCQTATDGFNLQRLVNELEHTK